MANVVVAKWLRLALASIKTERRVPQSRATYWGKIERAIIQIEQEAKRTAQLEDFVRAVAHSLSLAQTMPRRGIHDSSPLPNGFKDKTKYRRNSKPDKARPHKSVR